MKNSGANKTTNTVKKRYLKIIIKNENLSSHKPVSVAS